ncbi:hypothetical protein CASFOL_036583 [Castilleja foliolosa]|uniref:Ubiquitin-like protease family profile domain-containing protein n=1 Tax=Castilleja foliolosa TaxID=1961234 RepID=A0ABD3BXJ9_9LAMI
MKSSDLQEEFKRLFGNGQKNITANNVVDVMLTHTHGGVWFRRLFLIAMSTCLMDVTGNGYVPMGLLGNFDKVVVAGNLNWGEFVIRCLVDHNLQWKKKRDKYTGPIFFLLGVYVDRVEDFLRTVDQTFPTMIGWTSKMLYDRQKTEIKFGGFGGGHVAPRFARPENLHHESVRVHQSIGSAGVGRHSSDIMNERILNGSGSGPGDGMVFAKNLLKQAKIVANAVNGIVSMVESAPPELRGVLDDPVVMEMIIAVEESMPKKDRIVLYYDDPPNFNFDESQNPHVGGAGGSFTEQYPEQEMETSISVHDDETTGLDDGSTHERGRMRSSKAEKLKTISENQIMSDQSEDDSDDGDNTEKTVAELVDEADVGGEVRAGNKPTDSGIEKSRGVANEINIPVVEKESTAGDADKEMTKRGNGVAPQKVATKRTRSKRPSPDVRVALKKWKGKCSEDASKTDDDEDFTDSDVPEHERVVKRKKSGAGKSPYQSRVVDGSTYVLKEQRELCSWIMDNIDLSRQEIVFATNDTEIQREDVISLGAGFHVKASVIDLWCKILNANEALQAPTSPCRLFIPTIACAYCIYGYPADWEMKDRQPIFDDHLREVIEQVDGLKVEDIDMYFFTICHSGHLYIICYYVKLQRAEIIDNSAAGEDVVVDVKYSDIPASLGEMVKGFLSSKGLGKKAQFLKTLNYDRLKMSWRDEKNKVDCGVYVMRHMETYMGGSLRGWKCGLSKNNARQMKALRAKYAAAILGSEMNLHRVRIVSEVKKYYAEKIGSDLIGVDQLLVVRAAGEAL